LNTITSLTGEMVSHTKRERWLLTK
jgi:hypothetical protein